MPLFVAGVHDAWRRYFRGVAVSILVALAAAFLSEHYDAPAMLLAILIGLALHFLSDDPRTTAGLDFASRNLLRAGVALLGLRISAALIGDLGFGLILLVIAAVAATVAFGLLSSRLFGQDARFGTLTGGAVAICGASAAMAIAAVLGRSRSEEAEREMAFVVIGVTMLSTIAMILYPILADLLGLSDLATGIFLGATIHDVAQVAGAGFSVSPAAGETAVFVKLIRVSMLAPVVLLTALAFSGSRATGPSPVLFPGFLAVFIVLAGINSLIGFPPVVGQLAGVLSQWLLLTAIAAVGVKTSLASIFRVGRRAISLLVAETLFLAGLALLALMLLHPAGS